MKKFREIFTIFFTFLKIGLFTFGGGYAMISLIENECVDKKKWITSQDLMNCIAIAESTPGPIAINCATYVGYKKAGILGSIMATLGVVIPSFLIIFIISLFFNNLLEIKIVAHAFNGIKVAVAVLILLAGIKMLKQSEKDALSLTIMIISFIAVLLIDIFAWNFSAIFLILIGGLTGIIVYSIVSARKKKLNNSEEEHKDEHLS